MASVYKKGRDKGIKNTHYYIDYVDHLGKRRTVKGPTDKAMAERMAAKFENDAMLQREGLIVPGQQQEANRTSRLVEDCLQEFQKKLEGRKRTEKHRNLIVTRIRTVMNGCDFKQLRDINSRSIEEFLNRHCDSNSLGNKTFNHYLQAVEQFISTLTTWGYFSSDPVAGLQRRNCEEDVRKKRRSLNLDELSKLIESARSSGKSIQCYDGETRARLYILASTTGLRRSELSSLTPSSFDLLSSQPTVTIEATISKHRRKDTLPLHPDIIPLLRSWLAKMAHDQPLFPKLKRRRTWLMVKLDLERIGIPYTTAEGDADFHAAGRHTYITQLIRSGVSLSVTKQLARHADVNMTMRYTHHGLGEQANALASMPVPPLGISEQKEAHKSNEADIPKTQED